MSIISDMVQNAGGFGIESLDEFTGNPTDFHDSMEAISCDVEEAYSELKDDIVAIDAVTSSYEELDEILTDLEVSSESLTSETSVLISRQVRNALKPFGGALGSPVPSQECFSDETEAERNTTVSAEGLKDTLKSIWQTIKNLVIRAVAAVMNFFSKLFQGWKKIQARAEAIQTSIAGLSKDPEGTVKVKYISAMAFKGSAKSDVLVTGCEQLQSKMVAVKTSLAETDKAYARLVSGFEAAVKGDNKGWFEGAKAFFGAIKESGKDLSNVNLPGNNMLIALKGSVPVADDASDDVSKGLSYMEAVKLVIPTIKKNSTGKKADEHQVIDKGTKAQLTKLMAAVIDIANVGAERKKYIEQISQKRRDAVNNVDKAIADADKGFFKGGWDKGKIRLLARSVSRDASKYVNDLEKIAFSACRGYVSYAESSLSAK